MLFAAVLFAGCASSVETTMQPAWAVDVGGAEEVGVSPDGQTVFVGAGKDAALLEARDGRLIAQINDELTVGKVLKEATTVQGVQLATMDADDLSYVFLPEADVALLFDYTMSSNTVQAIDLQSGDGLWSSQDYAWTLEKYASAGRTAAASVFNALGAGAGTAAAAASEDLTRRRYVEDLITSVPELDAFLFKTLDGLYLLDPQTGEVRWSNEEVEGSGVGAVVYVPEDDALLLATNVSGLIDAMDGGKRLLRLDARTGDVMWAAPYRGSGDAMLGLRLIDETVLLDFEKGIAEGFDYQSGDALLESTADWQQEMGKMESAVGIGTPWTARPLVDGGDVYAVKSFNYKAVGMPDKRLVKLDLATGDVVWESDPVEKVGDLRDVMLLGDLVVARASGSEPNGIPGARTVGHGDRQVVAWDRQTGEQVWSRIVDEGRHNTNVIERDGRLYVADAATLYALDVASGDVLAQADIADAEAGGIRYLIDRGDELAVIASGGLAYYGLPDLALRRVTPIEGSAVDQLWTEDRLLVAARPGLMSKSYALQVLDLNDGRHVGTIGIDQEGARATGNLSGGYFLSADEAAVYVLHGDGTLARYDL